MSAQQDDTATPNVIRVGSETAVVVPVDEYRLLKTLLGKATPEEIEEAEAELMMAEYREWDVAGRPGAVSHEEAMAQLLVDP